MGKMGGEVFKDILVLESVWSKGEGDRGCALNYLNSKKWGDKAGGGGWRNMYRELRFKVKKLLV